MPARETTHLLLGHLWHQRLELGDVARVEREQQIPDHLAVGADERVEDGVHQLRTARDRHDEPRREHNEAGRGKTYQLAKVVDGAEEGRDAEVVGARDALFGRQVLVDVDARKEQERVLVVVGKLCFCLYARDSQQSALRDS